MLLLGLEGREPRRSWQSLETARRRKVDRDVPDAGWTQSVQPLLAAISKPSDPERDEGAARSRITLGPRVVR
jgi:hypothetical protein